MRSYDDIMERQSWFNEFLAAAGCRNPTSPFPRFSCPVCLKTERDDAGWARFSEDGGITIGCKRCEAAGETAQRLTEEIPASLGLTPPWLNPNRPVRYTRKSERKPMPKPPEHKPAYPPDVVYPKTDPTAGTPAEIYLTARLGDRPYFGVQPEQSVRWLPAKSHTLHQLPDDAAGAICYTYWATDKQVPQAMEMDALTAAGERTEPRWRRHAGSTKGAAFTASISDDRTPPYLIGIAEGPVSAMAIRCMADFDIVLGAGPANNLPNLAALLAARNIAEADAIIVADGDEQGEQQSLALQAALHEAGIAAAVEYCAEGEDPADRKGESDD